MENKMENERKLGEYGDLSNLFLLVARIFLLIVTATYQPPVSQA